MLVYGTLIPRDYCMTYVILEKNLDQSENIIELTNSEDHTQLTCLPSSVTYCPVILKKRRCENITDDGRIQL